MRVMKFKSQDEYEKWVDERQENDQSIDEIVVVVDEGFRVSVDLTTACKKPATAIRRMFKELSGIPELDGWQDGMTESIENGYYSDSDPRNYAWGVENYGDEDYDEYYVFLVVYREVTDTDTVEPESEQEDNAVCTEETVDEPIAGATSAGEPVTLDSIAREFSRQQKYYDEHWARSHRDSADSVVEYHYTWNDSDGFERRDWVSILLSDACRAAGVDFDVVEDEDDLEERVCVELVVQGYELDDDGDPVDEDGERARDDIREQIWQSAIDDANRARDELCLHEDIGEPWFRELVEEMYERVKASVGE